MSLNTLQKMVDDWIKTHGVNYFSELTNMVILMEEVGELARIMARKYGEQSFKPGETDEHIGEEMADILFVLICLANQAGVSLEKEFKHKMALKTERDHLRHLNNPKIKKQ